MRKVKVAALTVVFCMLLFGQPDGTPDHPYPFYATTTCKLVWTPPPDVPIAKAEAVIYNESGGQDDPTKVVALIEHESPTAEILIHQYVQGLPDGTYYVRVRIYNDNLVASAWSDEIVARKSWAPPAPPGGCRILPW